MGTRSRFGIRYAGLSTINDMSFRTTNAATICIKQEVNPIMKTLLDAENLPFWNPAFSKVTPSSPDGVYKITVHKVLRGNLEYRRPNLCKIELRISIPGLTEISTFVLKPKPHETQVTHTITQQGPLAAIIRNQEAYRVPTKRLTRLAQALKTN